LSSFGEGDVASVSGGWGRVGGEKVSYDKKCYELAEYFMSEDPIPDTATPSELAQLIQDTIEDYLRVDEPDERGSDQDEWRHSTAEQQRLKWNMKYETWGMKHLVGSGYWR
jgi:hypothetical protein